MDVVPLAERVLVAGRRESVRGAVISGHTPHFTHENTRQMVSDGAWPAL